jgi:hypothetical protein
MAKHECEAGAYSKLPHVTGSNGVSLVVATGSTVTYAVPSYEMTPGNPLSEFRSTSADLSSPPVLLGQTSVYYKARSMKRWGDGVVAFSSDKGAGANYKYSITFVNATMQSNLTDGTSVVPYAFSAFSDSVAYSSTLRSSPGSSELTRWTRTGNEITSSTSTVPAVNASLVALPEALLLFRRSAETIGTFSTCAYDDPGLCASEKSLPAAMGDGISEPFEIAHGRLYATRVAAGVASTVYCPTADVAAGTCQWTTLGSGFAPKYFIASLSALGHDEQHVYRARDSADGYILERIAR